MRVLVVGAGAVGGYFGGRLVEKGADVTFLVRDRRKQQLETGLVIHSVNGDASFPVSTITQGESTQPFDLIILTTKAYHLDEVLPSLSSYVAEHTTILPLLNGIAHFEKLRNFFGSERVIGGLCFIESTLNTKGEVEHYSPQHRIVFGEFDGKKTDRIRAIEDLFAGANLTAESSDNINNEIWKKYIFISAMAGMTCLTRSSIGPILKSPNGIETYERLLSEICAIGKSQEETLDADVWDQTMGRVRSLPDEMKSSMLRDMEKGLPIETDHFHGTLLRLAPADLDVPLLKTIYSTLSIYQATQAANK
ncbi:ketopantoate reductase family protein [Shimazuella sp. AN120528]|uniref:ketopantoate reductase family protein n=1 Tax=Shimazuella soli TaxID=1892854 RepID=UPI001F0E4254|nr:ketopantoate reductase family protein [Shimazuella soli]MCH5585147.1 ketopantoate reductase family protein [Shimazuella soli]